MASEQIRDDTFEDWICEKDIVRLTGLPGPLVSELLPRLPSLDDYSTAAAVYHPDSIYRAQIAVSLLHAGIRMPLIRASVSEPLSHEDLRKSAAAANEIAASGD